ncbi:MAG: AraC family transcriptional regulator [Firmicutes bacterium HGW-Firmicutes-14]|nr:MAG: AraC family transcriptional regulator [Firmicutes bacterium HGW-Firmicutes-14]
MKHLKEKVAYLQGLAQGLDIGDATKEGKVLSEIINVLGEMAGQIEDIETAQNDLEDYVESIDEDLYDLEDDLLGDLDEEDLIEIECPNCREIVCFEADIVDDEDLIEVTCPNCDEVVYINDQDILNGTNDGESMVGLKDEDL